MPTENAQAKGRRLLGEGRLTIHKVSDRAVVAECKGDSGEIYKLGWHPTQNRWVCECPAKGTCSHLRALMLVTVKPSPTSAT